MRVRVGVRVKVRVRVRVRVEAVGEQLKPYLRLPLLLG